MSVFRIFNYILLKLSSMIMFNSHLIQTMIHFLFAIAILLLLSMTRHPASVFTARFQDCEFVYHVLAQVVTMLHLTQWTPLQNWYRKTRLVHFPNKPCFYFVVILSLKNSSIKFFIFLYCRLSFVNIKIHTPANSNIGTIENISDAKFSLQK